MLSNSIAREEGGRDTLSSPLDPPMGVIGWSVICCCDISWSYLLFIYLFVVVVVVALGVAVQYKRYLIIVLDRYTNVGGCFDCRRDKGSIWNIFCDVTLESISEHLQ